MPLMMIVTLTMKIYLGHNKMSRIVRKSQKNIMPMPLMKIMYHLSKNNKRRLTLRMKSEKENLKMPHT